MRAIAIIAVGFAFVASTEANGENEPRLAFTVKNKITRWVGRDLLVAYPNKYRDEVVAFQA